MKTAFAIFVLAIATTMSARPAIAQSLMGNPKRHLHGGGGLALRRSQWMSRISSQYRYRTWLHVIRHW